MKKEAVDKIQEFIVKLRTNEKIVNNVIRDDVFSILEKKCTVLYFPLEDDIDGFHTIKNVNGEEEDFVFINSNKKTEKQIFIAAHELGHLVKVFSVISPENLAEGENEEDVVNRFAAELLMPEMTFKQTVIEKLSELDYDGEKISYSNLARLTAFLMSFFYVPLKSVLFRYYEIGRIEFDMVEKLYADKVFNDYLEQMIIEGGYTRLNKIPGTRSIKDLPYLLKTIKEKHVFSENHTQVLKDAFLIKDTGEEVNTSFKGEDDENTSDN